jgi:hypothetical protein
MRLDFLDTHAPSTCPLTHPTTTPPSPPTLHSIRWDEETIAEHDKLRGTRQKVRRASFHQIPLAPSP